MVLGFLNNDCPTAHLSDSETVHLKRVRSTVPLHTSPCSSAYSVSNEGPGAKLKEDGVGVGKERQAFQRGRVMQARSKHLVLPQPHFQTPFPGRPLTTYSRLKWVLGGLHFNGPPQYHRNTATLGEKTVLHPLKYSCSGRVHVPIATLFSVPRRRSLETLMGQRFIHHLFVFQILKRRSTITLYYLV
ncbi:unnamed protein product [Boreogadus saida]